MKTGRWILAGAVAAGAAAGAWLYFGGSGDEVGFVTVPARRGPIAAVVTATGAVNPVITVTVGSQISGQVQSLRADFNSVVRKGQVIATLDPSNLMAQVSRDRANVASAVAGLERARVEAQNSERAFERAKNLQRQDLLSQSDFDAAQAQAQSTAASVKTALAAIQEAKSSLQISEVNLAHATITSPVDGIVISRNVDVGQTVAASLQAPTLFTIAQDLRRMEVHMNVAEADIGRLAVGQDASFTVDAYPQDRFRGRISEIRNSPTTIQNVVTYEAVIGVDNTELKLKPGMTANVSVTVATKDDALLVPNAALRYKPPESIQRSETASAGTGQADSGKGAGASGSGATDATGQTSPGSGGRRPSSGGSDDASPGREGGARSSGPRGGRGPGGGASDRGGRARAAIWILVAGTPKRVPVSVGITDGSSTEITSGDLKDGDPVVTETTGSAAAAAATRPNRPGFGRMF